MAEHNLPWVYRPHEFDDWGWIRDSDGVLAACARGEKGDKTHAEHRADNTDPYGEYAALITVAVNNYGALVRALDEFQTAETAYRMAYDLDGYHHQNTLEARSKLRTAGYRARELLAVVVASQHPGASSQGADSTLANSRSDQNNGTP